MSKEVKQVIVMRKDLNMRKGKMVAQGAHASMKVFLDKSYVEDGALGFPITAAMELWLTEGFAKICLGVESEQELLELYSLAKKASLPCALITDSGRTEFHGEPTNTCIAIGPDYSDRIDKITGHLKLL